MIDFLILTALPEELDAVLEALGDYVELDKEYDTATYYAAKVPTTRNDRSTYDIRVTCLSGMGPITAAAHAVVATSRWKTQAVLLVGVAGGYGADISLGDILIADQVADYTLGRVASTAEGDVIREIRWIAHPTDVCLLDSAARLRDWAVKMPAKPDGSAPPRLVRGTIVSGGDVVTADRLAKEHAAVWPKIIGFEMEGGAVATALHATFERPRFFMVRSVQDLADANKAATEKAGWREFACRAAAAFAVALLRRGPLVACAQEASAAPPPPPVDVQGDVSRARDILALRRVMEQVALDDFELFIERARAYVIISRIFWYYEGFCAAQSSNLNHIVDPTLRTQLDEVATAFHEALHFQDYFSPRGDDCIINLRGVSDSSKIVEAFVSAIERLDAAMKSLTRHISERWLEVDLAETTLAARTARLADESRFASIESDDEAPSEQPQQPGGVVSDPGIQEAAVRDAMNALVARAKVIPLAFVEGQDTQDVTLEICSLTEQEAARRLEADGLATDVSSTLCTLRVGRT